MEQEYDRKERCKPLAIPGERRDERDLRNENEITTEKNGDPYGTDRSSNTMFSTFVRRLHGRFPLERYVFH